MQSACADLAPSYYYADRDACFWRQTGLTWLGCEYCEYASSYFLADVICWSRQVSAARSHFTYPRNALKQITGVDDHRKMGKRERLDIESADAALLLPAELEE